MFPRPKSRGYLCLWQKEVTLNLEAAKINTMRKLTKQGDGLGKKAIWTLLIADISKIIFPRDKLKK